MAGCMQDPPFRELIWKEQSAWMANILSSSAGFVPGIIVPMGMMHAAASKGPSRVLGRQDLCHLWCLCVLGVKL